MPDLDDSIWYTWFACERCGSVWQGLTERLDCPWCGHMVYERVPEPPVYEGVQVQARLWEAQP